MTDPAHPNSFVGTIFLIGFIAFVLAMRFRRMRRGRRLRLEWLWVVPAIYGALAAWLLSISSPSPRIQVACAVAAILGGLIGWQRARLVALSIDPDSHRLTQRESPWAMLLIVMVIALRLAARTFGDAQFAGDAQSGTWHVGVVAMTDILVAFAFGLLAIQRLVLWRRGSALLAAGRSG